MAEQANPRVSPLPGETKVRARHSSASPNATHQPTRHGARDGLKEREHLVLRQRLVRDGCEQAGVGAGLLGVARQVDHVLGAQRADADQQLRAAGDGLGGGVDGPSPL